MDSLQQTSLTGALSKAAVAAGTTTTYTTTGNTVYCINGKAYSAAAVTNAATPTTDITTGAAFPAQAIGSGSVYVYGLNAAGAIKVAKGTDVTLAADGSFLDLPSFPALPEDFCPIAYQLVRLAPSTATTPAVATWTFGTNNQSGVTGVTYARQDVALGMPARPQAA